MDTKYPYSSPEIWGGLECTINRVGDLYRDQFDLTGHYGRADDIERIARLGIRKLRYPVLWEKHENQRGQKIDWRWSAEQLNAIRNIRMVPIVGLLHHGSGPSFTDLSDINFPEKFAIYASKVATRFPWINFYTPVNEPLTTARFSGLYGFWYPHARDEFIFAKILLNELKATVLAMQAIRKINPGAQLIQTEDLSKTHSTPLLRYQADFENERRWVTNDILCGKVDKDHFFWDYFTRSGIPESSLYFFLEHPCPPSIIGFNYYVTSERFLDESVDKYPFCIAGGNGRHVYIDTEAVRAGQNAGLAELLKEAWQRYDLPLAITECHLSCTREEQLRWLYETWKQCCQLNDAGVDIRAVTAWSLFGAYDWNSLLTVNSGHYEPGVFDISNGRVRQTQLSKLVHSLATSGDFTHPLLSEQGWWHQERTLTGKKPLLIIGKTGTLGKAFVRICDQRGITCIALGREDIDILDEVNVETVFEKYQPWGVINATGYVKVDEAEIDCENCRSVNTIAPGILARVCAAKEIRFMSFSSDLVFDGSKKSPYHETDIALPLNVYGRSKSEGEKLVLGENSSSLIIRTSAFFGPWDRYNFVYHVLNTLQQEKTMTLPGDVIISPTYVPDLCHTAMDLFIDDVEGIWHLSNEGMTTWAEFGNIIADRSGCKKRRLVSKPLAEMGWRAPRPLYSVLESDRGVKLPPLDTAIERFFAQREV